MQVMRILQVRDHGCLVNIIVQHHIREACSDDAEAIARLVRILGYELGPACVTERMAVYQSEFSRVFIAANPIDLIGFLSFHAIPLFHEVGMLGRITAMAVAPHHQREGVGSSLVHAAENFAVTVGCARMEVTSGDKREQDAHRFYIAQGYHSDCRRFLKHLPTIKQG